LAAYRPPTPTQLKPEQCVADRSDLTHVFTNKDMDIAVQNLIDDGVLMWIRENLHAELLVLTEQSQPLNCYEHLPTSLAGDIEYVMLSTFAYMKRF
jgi:hypothetical protein